MTAQKEEWVKLGCDIIYRSHTSSLQSLEEDMTFFTFVVDNTKSQETESKIILQQLKTQCMNSGNYVILYNLDPFFLAPRRKIQIKNFFAMYIRKLSRFKT